MGESRKSHEVVLAAGGIVVRDVSEPLIAVVQLRKDKAWVLPKGKLRPDEESIAAAKREVMEETGYDVSVHEFLGSMSHAAAGRLKVVQFWHMRAVGAPVRKPMDDVKSVKWLPLKRAISALTRTHEKVFLANAGPAALNAARPHPRPAAGAVKMTPVNKVKGWLHRLTHGGSTDATALRRKA